ncbi:hypothetical protein LNTAR_15167 [Lentisphaera araneosa HTCC2155]|uniref:Uncharacterized protein n=1 Tax=Lentisphaera araneosa HTCC2155 TaxID=313628 RepID=A6DRF8_9BACT|nr:hypothetical protein [Lentisphaera araneosa]EDM25768.1 hypothetical protein LNTAR_15167 [Lentisphaera araneosa HTCC2155]
MKKLMIILTLLPVVVLSSPQESIKKSLDAWAPLSVIINNKELIIAMSAHHIRDKLYQELMIKGIMAYAGLKDQRALYRIEKIMILNKFKNQGYVFTGNTQRLTDLTELSGSNQKRQLMKYSRRYEP